METWKKIMAASALMLILAFSTFAIGSAEAQDGDSGGGPDTSDTVEVTFEITGAEFSGWGSAPDGQVWLNTGNNSERIYDDHTISLAKGSEYTIMVEEGGDSWTPIIPTNIEIEYNDGSKYSLGTRECSEPYPNGDPSYIEEYTILADSDCTVHISFGKRDIQNAATIVNNSDNVTIQTMGGSSVEPGESLVNYGHDPYSIFKVTFVSEGLIPEVTYDQGGGQFKVTSDSIEFECYGGNSTIEIEFTEPSVAFNKTEIELDSESSERLELTYTPDSVNGMSVSVEWDSSNTSIATIDSRGQITATSPGSCVITATVNYGGLEISATCNVTVIEPVMYGISVIKNDGGTVEINPESAREGAEVFVQVILNDNYKLDSITAMKEDGTEVELQKTDDGYTFEMPASNVTVNASFSLVEHTVTFKVDGENYHEDTYKHGETIELPTDPSKESTVDTVFEFTGWEGYTENMPATEDHVFNAQFNESVRQYEIDFTMDGTTFRDYTLDYGATIIAPEDDPTKAETVFTTYTFDHWDGYSEGMTVTGDHTFEAVFSESPRMYDMIFVVDGTFYYENEQAYGSVVEVPADPEKSGYDFVGWDGYTTGMTVTSDHTFTAMFEKSYIPFPPYFPDDDEWFPVYPGGGGGSADDDITNFNPNYPNTGGLTDEELSVLLMTLAIICALFAIFLLILAKRRKDDEEDERS